MVDLYVPSPDLGIDVSRPANMIDDRAAAEDTQNVDFDAGIAICPFGFSQISDLLESGEKVFGLFCYKEVDGRMNIVAATATKVHQHNPNNDTWDELSGATIDANERYRVSFANVLHQDAIGSPSTYQNMLVCDGGRSNIIRWPGNGSDLSELAGGDDYNLGGETGHRARQVCTVQNRTILISPYEYDGSVWRPNESKIRYSQQAKLESWTGTGSGTSLLIDTGDVNVRGELLGYTLIIYQQRSIWQLRYVGGTDVFTPDILVNDKGLLDYKLVCPIGGVHAIVASDYNPYLFAGGYSMGQPIGNNIADVLKVDLQNNDPSEYNMAVDANQRFLWIWVSRTKAYKINLRNQSWTVRDFSHKYSSGGISTASLLTTGTYHIGMTYADAVDDETTYCEAIAGTAITLDETPTATTWDAGGTQMTGTGSHWNTAGDTLVSVGDIVHIVSGTNATPGWYMVESVTDDTHLELDRSIGSSPSSVTYLIYQDDGDSYADTVTELRSEERLAFGDTEGYVFQEDSTVTTDDDIEGTHYYYTKEFDGGYPDVYKRFDGIAFDAKYPSFSSSGTITVDYKIDDGNWTQICSVSLTSGFVTYRRFINRTGRKIQFRFGGIFSLRSFKIFNVQPESER